VSGLLARFEGPESLLAAARRARGDGYRRLDAFTPFPVEGLGETLGARRFPVPLIVLLGGIAGGLGGFLMQWFASAVHWRLNVGGRPLNSWPAFIPITFEMTVLFAGLAGLAGMLALNRLPRYHHPLFDAPGFERASRDAFLLWVGADDPRFERERTARWLREAGAAEIVEVPAPEAAP